MPVIAGQTKVIIKFPGNDPLRLTYSGKDEFVLPGYVWFRDDAGNNLGVNMHYVELCQVVEER